MRKTKWVAPGAKAMIAALVILIPLAAKAATSSPMAPEMAALRATPAYQQAIINGALKTTAWVNAPCDKAKASFARVVAIIQAPAFDAKGQAVIGKWIEHVRVEGCEKPRLYNVLVTAKAPGQLETMPMLPGTSRADALLQKDGSVYAFAAATTDPKGCKPIYLQDTAFVRVLDDKPPVGGKSAWVERWTVAQCKTRIPVTLTFTPDEHGTNVTAMKDKPGP